MNYVLLLFHLKDTSVLKAIILIEYADAYKVLLSDTGKQKNILKQDIIRLNNTFIGLRRVRLCLRKSKDGLEVIINSIKPK